MLDRYTKVVWTVMAVALTVLALNSLSILAPTARAQSAPPTKRCIWTQVRETGEPSLGENGAIKLGREWQPLSEAGWELKAVAAMGGLSSYAYIFERCEPR